MGGQRPEAVSNFLSRVVDFCDSNGFVQPAEPTPVVVLPVQPPNPHHIWYWNSRSDAFMKPIFNMESKLKDIVKAIDQSKYIFTSHMNQMQEHLESSRLGFSRNPWTKDELLGCRERLLDIRDNFVKSLDESMKRVQLYFMKISAMERRVKFDGSRKTGPAMSRIPEPEICHHTRHLFLQRAHNIKSAINFVIEDVLKKIQLQTQVVMGVVGRRMGEAAHREKEFMLRKKKLRRRRSARA